MRLVEFTQPGDTRPAQKIGNRNVPERIIPPARFMVRADLIVAIEEPAEDGEYVEVRTAYRSWEVTETYAQAVALWDSPAGPFTDRVHLASHADTSATYRDGYDPGCSWCWLGYAHSTAAHAQSKATRTEARS